MMLIEEHIEDIEERKIEILTQVAALNKEYRKRLDHLNMEYEVLRKELYRLRIQKISKNEAEVLDL